VKSIAEVRSTILAAHDQLMDLIGNVTNRGVAPSHPHSRAMVKSLSLLVQSMVELDGLDLWWQELPLPPFNRN
jgi:hypothetical protein